MEIRLFPRLLARGPLSSPSLASQPVPVESGSVSISTASLTSPIRSAYPEDRKGKAWWLLTSLVLYGSPGRHPLYCTTYWIVLPPHGRTRQSSQCTTKQVLYCTVLYCTVLRLLSVRSKRPPPSLSALIGSLHGMEWVSIERPACMGQERHDEHGAHDAAESIPPCSQSTSTTIPPPPFIPSSLHPFIQYILRCSVLGWTE
jgi:hypothetical protein